MILISSDLEQFQRFQEGNKEAYGYFFLKHQEHLYNYIRKMASDGELAKDLTQDTFKRLWDLRANLRNDRHLAAYIYVMARHLFLVHLRKVQSRSDAARDLVYAAGLEENMNEELEIVCRRILVEIKTAVNGMSPQRKLVLRLLFVQELDIPTIAQRLRLSPQTVRNHKAQAIAFLRQKLYDRDLVMPLILSILLRYLEE